MPKLFNLRMDPFEKMDHESVNYDQWTGEVNFFVLPAVVKVAQIKATFKEFPQRQKPGSFVPYSPVTTRRVGGPDGPPERPP